MSDARDKILARRAKFVAAALAGISVAYAEACKPQPCLEIAPTSPDVAPGPSLAPASTSSIDAAAAEPAADAGALEASAPSPAVQAHEALSDAGAADAGKKRGASDAGEADAGRLKPLPPATRLVVPPPPPRPCLLLHIVEDEL